MSDKDIVKKFNKISKKCGIQDEDTYDVIVIDPPWNQGKTARRGVRPNQGTKLDYPTLLFDEIKLLPVDKWSKDPSFIFLSYLILRDLGAQPDICILLYFQGGLYSWGTYIRETIYVSE